MAVVKIKKKTCVWFKLKIKSDHSSLEMEAASENTELEDGIFKKTLNDTDLRYLKRIFLWLFVFDSKETKSLRNKLSHAFDFKDEKSKERKIEFWRAALRDDFKSTLGEFIEGRFPRELFLEEPADSFKIFDEVATLFPFVCMIPQVIGYTCFIEKDGLGTPKLNKWNEEIMKYGNEWKGKCEAFFEFLNGESINLNSWLRHLTPLEFLQAQLETNFFSLLERTVSLEIPKPTKQLLSAIAVHKKDMKHKDRHENCNTGYTNYLTDLLRHLRLLLKPSKVGEKAKETVEWEMVNSRLQTFRDQFWKFPELLECFEKAYTSFQYFHLSAHFFKFWKHCSSSLCDMRRYLFASST